jgi:hypothetical protein
MGMFGKPEPPQKAPDRVDKFIDAVIMKEDSLAAQKMLEEAGGMCNAIAFAKAAHDRSREAHLKNPTQWSQVHISMASHGNEQTLSVGNKTTSRYISLYTPMASITDKKCER